MSDTEEFTKIASSLLLNVRNLVNWGIDTGNTTSEKLRLTVAARQEAAIKLVEGGMSQREAAKVLGVDQKTISNDLRNNSSESEEKFRARDEKEALIRAQNAELKLVKSDIPAKTYGTIVIDPPWEMEKIKRDVRPNQVAFDYPTMTAEELEAYPVLGLAAEDCHLFCWTTQKHLPIALQLVEVWTFKYVLLMTWHKPGGFQPHGLPQYNSEFVIYARRGMPKFRDTQAFNTCFQGERREHSRKPDVFYDTIRRVTDDGRIDVFSREKREGFEQVGNEADKFKEAAQ